jgi:hypothetical protein
MRELAEEAPRSGTSVVTGSGASQGTMGSVRVSSSTSTMRRIAER